MWIIENRFISKSDIKQIEMKNVIKCWANCRALQQNQK